MRRFAVSASLTLVFGVVTLPLAASAQSGKSVLPVSVDGLKALSSVDLSLIPGPRGGLPATPNPATAPATASGEANSGGLLDMLVNVGVGGKPHVQIEVHVGDQCVDNRVRIAMVASGVDPSMIPAECRRRMAGIFWLDRATHVTVHVATGTLSVQNSGMGTGAKIGLGTGAAAAIVGGALAAGGGGSTSSTPTTPTSSTPPPTTTPTPPTTTPPPTTPTPPPPAAPTASLFAGGYNGSGPAGPNTCLFSPTTTISAQITVTDNANSIITWTKTHTNAGVTFTFNNVKLNIASATSATFSAATAQSIQGVPFNVTDSGTISGTTLNVVQTLKTTDGSCQVVYNLTLTKQGG